jgi:hypothetical protein
MWLCYCISHVTFSLLLIATSNVIAHSIPHEFPWNLNLDSYIYCLIACTIKLYNITFSFMFLAGGQFLRSKMETCSGPMPNRKLLYMKSGDSQIGLTEVITKLSTKKEDKPANHCVWVREVNLKYSTISTNSLCLVWPPQRDEHLFSRCQAVWQGQNSLQNCHFRMEFSFRSPKNIVSQASQSNVTCDNQTNSSLWKALWPVTEELVEMVQYEQLCVCIKQCIWKRKCGNCGYGRPNVSLLT